MSTELDPCWSVLLDMLQSHPTFFAQAAKARMALPSDAPTILRGKYITHLWQSSAEWQFFVHSKDPAVSLGNVPLGVIGYRHLLIAPPFKGCPVDTPLWEIYGHMNGYLVMSRLATGKAHDDHEEMAFDGTDVFSHRCSAWYLAAHVVPTLDEAILFVEQDMTKTLRTAGQVVRTPSVQDFVKHVDHWRGVSGVVRMPSKYSTGVGVSYTCVREGVPQFLFFQYGPDPQGNDIPPAKRIRGTPWCAVDPAWLRLNTLTGHECWAEVRKIAGELLGSPQKILYVGDYGTETYTFSRL